MGGAAPLLAGCPSRRTPADPAPRPTAILGALAAAAAGSLTGADPVTPPAAGTCCSGTCCHPRTSRSGCPCPRRVSLPFPRPPGLILRLRGPRLGKQKRGRTPSRAPLRREPPPTPGRSRSAQRWPGRRRAGASPTRDGGPGRRQHDGLGDGERGRQGPRDRALCEGRSAPGRSRTCAGSRAPARLAPDARPSPGSAAQRSPALAAPAAACPPARARPRGSQADGGRCGLAGAVVFLESWRAGCQSGRRTGGPRCGSRALPAGCRLFWRGISGAGRGEGPGWTR